MEPEPGHIFIDVCWKSLEEKQKYLYELTSIVEKDALLDIWGGFFSGDLELNTIGFRELSNISIPLWVNAINNVVVFLNKNNIDWKSIMVSCIDEDLNAEDGCSYGYFILHKDYLIISTMNRDGISTPKIYPIGLNEKLL